MNVYTFVSFNPLNNPLSYVLFHDAYVTNEELRFREVKVLSQVCTAVKWGRRDHILYHHIPWLLTITQLAMIPSNQLSIIASNYSGGRTKHYETNRQ